MADVPPKDISLRRRRRAGAVRLRQADHNPPASASTPFLPLIHPDYEGRVEQVLIAAVLQTLQSRHPDGDVQIRLNATKKAEIEALTACGFVKRRTLVTMELRLPT